MATPGNAAEPHAPGRAAATQPEPVQIAVRQSSKQSKPATLCSKQEFLLKSICYWLMPRYQFQHGEVLREDAVQKEAAIRA